MKHWTIERLGCNSKNIKNIDSLLMNRTTKYNYKLIHPSVTYWVVKLLVTTVASRSQICSIPVLSGLIPLEKGQEPYPSAARERVTIAPPSTPR